MKKFWNKCNQLKRNWRSNISMILQKVYQRNYIRIKFEFEKYLDLLPDIDRIIFCRFRNGPPLKICSFPAPALHLSNGPVCSWFFFHQYLSNTPFSITFPAVPSQPQNAKNMYNNLLLFSDLKCLDM
jgi:hypothetical protein